MKTNVIVADEKFKDLFKNVNAKFLLPTEYILKLNDYKGTSFNLYNLGNSTNYQTNSYYVSLLAHARNHRVFPSITLIQDLKYKEFHYFYSDDLNSQVQKKLKKIQSDHFEISSYFGFNLANSYNEICKQFYKILQAPLFRIYFKRNGNFWHIEKIKLLSLNDLSDSHLDFVKETAKDYFSKEHRYRSYKSKSLFDIAIWIDPNEEHPPSNEKALEKFIKAGNDLGLNVDIITKKDTQSILEYDGLFIRETTKLNHITYRIARKAEYEGLVVIDDPNSILKCTNKIFLEELLDELKINRPRSAVLHKKNYKELHNHLGFPKILKKPDSAFSQGVFKAKNEEEYFSICNKLFEKSELILMQEYIQTDFDWRIGILNDKILYACKYYMAHGHWQIINYNKKTISEGDHENIPVEKVPKEVAEIALKACKHIGSGLYGVDIKELNGKVFVIEVNDNPSIDSGVEDGLLGNDLYLKIMQYFLDKCHEKRTVNGNS